MAVTSTDKWRCNFKLNTTAETIRAAVAEICAIDTGNVRPEGELLGYGVDSLRTLELVMELEDRLGIQISDHDPALGEVRTIQQLADFIDRRLAGDR